MSRKKGTGARAPLTLEQARQATLLGERLDRMEEAARLAADLADGQVVVQLMPDGSRSMALPGRVIATGIQQEVFLLKTELTKLGVALPAEKPSLVIPGGA
jgi:hypothetical protein